MRSGWPHTQADHERLQAEERRGPFGPDISWPTGYSNLEYRDGEYRYSAPATGQPPAFQGAHPYAAFSAAGYGDDGYSDLGYDGPAAQDSGYQQPGYAGTGYAGDGQTDFAYPARDQHAYRGPGGYPGGGEPAAPDSRWQAWDYDQPLRYEDDKPAHPGPDSYGQDSYGEPDGYRQPAGYRQQDDYRGSDRSDGYGPGSAGLHAAPVYDPAAYNGSDYSRPGIEGPGYDLSGIISTGDFEAFGYDEPGYDRLAYDDPRYSDAPGGGSTYGGSPYRGGQVNETAGNPRLDDTGMDLGGFGGTRFGDTRFDRHRSTGPQFDETRLDSLWLSDEDVRQSEATGYENDGFGGDATVRSGYSYSGVSDETRLDLDQTRFDVPAYDMPAYDETRIDSMLALQARPSATGLLAPPEELPVSWAEETSFDDFGDFGDLRDEPMRAPAAFTRTMDRPDDTGARRAIGRRRGRSGDRKQWLALGAIAVVAAGAIGGVLMKYVFSGPSGPAHTVVAPTQADGFTRMPNLEKQMKVDALAASISKDSSGQVSNLVPAVYEQGSAVSGANPQIFMFVGGKLAGASPSASVTSFEADYPGAKVVPAGSLGGEAVCAQRQLNGEGVSMCVWFDNDTFGALVSPTMSTAKLATTLDQVRPSLELYAK